jgi:hypothetical protein
VDSIEKYKGLHRGKRLFILASGPSLGDLDLSQLDRRITMGLNRSVLVYPNTYYHCVMDQRLFDMYGDELHKTRQLFTVEERPFGIKLKNLAADGFSEDLTQGIYTGYTIAYFALQLALYMQFKEVFYLGLDLKNDRGRTHFFGRDEASGNHDQTEYPKMAKMLDYASRRLRKHNITVYNCSPVSTLKCFRQISYEEALRR